jgi:hypothetical protein
MIDTVFNVTLDVTAFVKITPFPKLRLPCPEIDVPTLNLTVKVVVVEIFNVTPWFNVSELINNKPCGQLLSSFKVKVATVAPCVEIVVAALSARLAENVTLVVNVT